MKTPDQPLLFQNRVEWRAWLEANHAGESEAWLTFFKKAAARPGVTYEEAVEEALCFGWIDGLTQSVDAERWAQRFSPRKRGSRWSTSNQARVARMLEQGLMTEAGLARVREAQANGEWEAAIRREDISRLPEALSAALAADPAAQASFDRLPPSQKKMFLSWIDDARTEKTRQERVQKTVAMLARGERLGG